MNHPHDSVRDYVKGSDKVPKEVVIITTMMNDRSGMWGITEDRVALLSRNKRRLTPTHRVAVEEMLVMAKNGDRFWKTRAEYQAALLQLSLMYQKPTDQNVEAVLMAARVGAAHDGVLGRPWMKEMLELLERLLVHDPGRPNALEGLDDEYADSPFHVP